MTAACRRNVKHVYFQNIKLTYGTFRFGFLHTGNLIGQRDRFSGRRYLCRLDYRHLIVVVALNREDLLCPALDGSNRDVSDHSRRWRRRAGAFCAGRWNPATDRRDDWACSYCVQDPLAGGARPATAFLFHPVKRNVSWCLVGGGGCEVIMESTSRRAVACEFRGTLLQ